MRFTRSFSFAAIGLPIAALLIVSSGAPGVGVAPLSVERLASVSGRNPNTSLTAANLECATATFQGPYWVTDCTNQPNGKPCGTCNAETPNPYAVVQNGTLTGNVSKLQGLFWCANLSAENGTCQGQQCASGRSGSCAKNHVFFNQPEP